jgi:hypothetical protein
MNTKPRTTDKIQVLCVANGCSAVLLSLLCQKDFIALR